MKKILFGFLALLTLAWGGSLLYGTGLPEGGALWLARAEALNLTGIWAIGLMSLVMFLSTRPVWLEKPVGGLDQMYRLHKWAGILAISFGALHWLVEMSDDIIKGLVGKAGKISREHGSSFFEMMRDAGKDMGEWAIYLLLAMLVLTLWKRFPFRFWRIVHRVMPVLYLMLVVHALFLSPLGYWSQPVGWLLGAMLLVGSVSCVVSLMGRIGREKQVAGEIMSVSNPVPSITQVVCKVADTWPGHKAGQFVFLTLHPREGAHPFTIASADRGDHCLSFQIKGLGDYTQELAQRLVPGQPVKIEGPYGCFNFSSGKARQVWVAGGIGITPFIAGLEALAHQPELIVDLYYCTSNSEQDPFVARLKALCAPLPQVNLHIRDTSMAGPLTAEILQREHDLLEEGEIWFCGPQGFSRALRRGLADLGLGGIPFHQEAFEMR